MTKRTDSTFQMQGSMTALATPFRSGEVDLACMQRLVDRQIGGGTDWLVPCGTTGESPTLSPAEHDHLLAAVIAQSAGRRPVMAGTGTNATVETVRRTRAAASAGADAALVVAPYYNRPTEEGLFRHFAAVADAVDIPIVLYNVPFRTGVSISNDVIVRLRNQYPHIVALKHATGSVDGVTELLSRCDITVLSGDDNITWPLMAMGAKGVISVASNLRPALMKSLVDAALAGDMVTARSHHDEVFALAAALGRFGPNPIPIKTAMALAGLCNEEFRLPLCPMEESARANLERLLRRAPQPEPVPA